MTSGTYLPRLALLACFAAACSSPVETPPPPPPPPPPLTGAAPFVVSNSVNQVAFVSLSPGTLASGSGVTLRVQRTGAKSSAALVGGGLDPVGIPAVAGDTISLTLTGSAAPVSPWVFTVPSRMPPVLIRTEPQANNSDVALNVRILVVFSEPIDSASLTPPDFDLRSGGNTIAGQFRFENPEHTVVEFTPAANLAAGTKYELVLQPGILDLEGTPLEAAASISFTTAQTIQANLAFVRGGQIYVLDADGGLLQLTNTGDDVSNRDLAWSPDGQRLAFASYREGSWDIYVMNADGSNVVRLTSGGYNVQPAWSPDGRTIAFTSFHDGSVGVWVMDADGGARRVLLDRPGYDADPAWSPDGQKITFTSDWRAYDFVYDLYVMNADGSDVRALLEGPFFGPATFYWQSAWSPDGQKIAVGVFTDNGSRSAIGVMNADGSGLKVIAPAGANPTWSPDGNTIAFGSPCAGCQPSVRFVRTDGSAAGLIVTNGHSPAWRP